MNEKIGKIIASRLKTMQKPQAWLAEQLGVSINAVSKWTKTGKISREKVPGVAKALGLSVDELIGDAIPSGASVAKVPQSKLERLDPQEAEMLRLFRECGPGERQILLSQADVLSGVNVQGAQLFRVTHKP